jgi:hypothetical protein
MTTLQASQPYSPTVRKTRTPPLHPTQHQFQEP